MIFPEVFDGLVLGFFTDREVGVNARALTDRHVYFPVQEHTDTVITLGSDLKRQVGDAVITNHYEVILGIKTADCVPILILDPVHSAIGAVHAGWRGTAKQILKRTIEAMQKTYGSEPQELRIAMGPAIRWCCYEVGQEVLDQISEATGPGQYHRVQDGKHCLDLPSANAQQALSMGALERYISMAEDCTFCYPERYFSYRYNKTNGRQGGFIGLP